MKHVHISSLLKRMVSMFLYLQGLLIIQHKFFDQRKYCFHLFTKYSLYQSHQFSVANFLKFRGNIS